MPAEDQRDVDGAAGVAPTPEGQPSGASAAPAAPIWIPSLWPEAIAYWTGVRLFDEGADEVPMMLRNGLPIAHYLTTLELGALMALPEDCWSRWFRLGWSRAADETEGEDRD